MKIDPTEEHALVDVDGARWVLFKLDIGRRFHRAVSSASTVGQTMGRAVVNATPEEQITAIIRQARENSRINGVGGAWLQPPAAPLSFP